MASNCTTLLLKMLEMNMGWNVTHVHEKWMAGSAHGVSLEATVTDKGANKLLKFKVLENRDD